MDKKEFLNNILKIHSVAVSTIDKNGLPSSSNRSKIRRCNYGKVGFFN